MFNYTIIICLILLSIQGTVFGINVKADGTGDYPTIQNAIDAAVAGDVINLQPGTYTGAGNRDIDFKGKTITVKGLTADPNNCIIDCQGNSTNPHRGFKFISGEGPDSILEAVKIINGYGPKENAFGNGDLLSVGGAIYCKKSSPTIKNCIISNNSAIEGISSMGGGIFNISNNSIIINCIISNNSVTLRGGGISDNNSSSIIKNCSIIYNSTGYDGYGGGISIDGPTPSVSDCNISYNLASYGGGIHNFSNSDINNCLISNNTARYFGGGMFNAYSKPSVSGCIIRGNKVNNISGGGIYNTGSSPTISGCIIADNSTGSYGGGIFNDNNSSPIINNCKIYNNSAGSYGGGIYNLDSSNPVIFNCLISNNSAPLGGGIHTYFSEAIISSCTIINNSSNLGDGGGIYDNSYGSSYINNSIIWNNKPTQIYINGTVRFSDVQGGYAGIGNIDLNPHFAEDGFHLIDVSPCINSGDPNYIAGPNETDIDGGARIVDARIDIGADEFGYIGDFDFDYKVDFADFAIFVNYWQRFDILRDLAPPTDVIDMEDLIVFCDKWLNGF